MNANGTEEIRLVDLERRVERLVTSEELALGWVSTRRTK